MTGPRWRPLTEGGALIVPLVAASVLALLVFPPLAPAALLAACAATLAFRDPQRPITQRPDVALAPADGNVIAIRHVFDDYWQSELIEIAVFLALWDVHVQRCPLDGKVVAQQHRAGGYRPAMTERATYGNNQLATYVETGAGPCTVTQISGLLARRIVTWAHIGDELVQGERLGMIKFGSQVTLRVPVTAAVLVEVGQHVEAGLTPFARLRGPEHADSPA